MEALAWGVKTGGAGGGENAGMSDEAGGSPEGEAAKSDGRWDRAYAGSKAMKIPADLQAAIDAEPKAREMLTKLSAQNRFALAFRVHNMKTDAGRKKKIAALVEMLKRGDTIYPRRTPQVR